MSRLFLGLDSSTQSLSAIVIDLDARRGRLRTLAEFRQRAAELRHPEQVFSRSDPLVKHSPPQMWVDALALMFAQMKKDKVPLGQILAVAGSGQQHGSVYLKADGTFSRADVTDLDGFLDHRRVRGDSSGAGRLGPPRRDRLRYVRAVHRSADPEICKTEPARYAATGHIALVSSFMAALLAGRIAPIDHGDGAGMNLMDIQRKQWQAGALEATAPDLTRKLPPLAESWTVLGAVSPRGPTTTD